MSIPTVRLYEGHCLDVLKTMPSRFVQCVVTSPPYYALRDYGSNAVEWPDVRYTPLVGTHPIFIDAQSVNLGFESTVSAYIGHLVLIFRELHRVLDDGGVVWLNLGDSYVTSVKGSGSASPKQLSNRGSRYTAFQPEWDLPQKNIGSIPWRVALALQADGWILRQDIVWTKPNAFPESVTDRCVLSHEYIFMLVKSERYYSNFKAIRESGLNERRNKRSVWSYITQPYGETHFAVMPAALVKTCILASTASKICTDCKLPVLNTVCRCGNPIVARHKVLDPFNGSGTTALVAAALNRHAIGIDSNTMYVELAEQRLQRELGLNVDIEVIRRARNQN